MNGRFEGPSSHGTLPRGHEILVPPLQQCDATVLAREIFEVYKIRVQRQQRVEVFDNGYLEGEMERCTRCTAISLTAVIGFAESGWGYTSILHD